MGTVKIGGERLLVKFGFKDCTLYAWVLAMDEELRENITKAIFHKTYIYYIKSVYRPELRGATLYIRGKDKDFDNKCVSYSYPSVEKREEAFDAFVRLIKEINHEEAKKDNEIGPRYDISEAKWIKEDKVKNKEDNKMKKGEIQLVKNELRNVIDGELELLVPGYSATDFDVMVDKYSVLITYKDLNTEEKKLITLDINDNYKAKIEECSCKNGIFKLKVSYDLGEKVEVEGE